MKRPSGQAIIPLALLGLVALVGGLVYHARSLEASHRATAESALRDYAALAAWQYTERAQNVVASTAHLTLALVQHPYLHRPYRTGELPGPEKIVKFGDTTACGLAPEARFTFRLDLPSKTLHVAGDPPSREVREALADRFATLAADTSLERWTIRMFVDTVGGAARAISYGVVRGLDSLPRAVYGVETDPSALVGLLRDIPKDKPLLPPSLLRGQPIDSFLMVEVRRADGGVLATIGAAEGPISAQERANGDAGSLVTRVVVRPQAASILLIGGIPDSRLNMLLLLLAGSVAVAGVALWQIRRGRELTRLRTRFVASVSHELRTPLAQISMFSETLLLGRERSREEGREFISIIFREARRLSQLVESVLRYSRSEAGGAPRELRLEPADVALEVRDAVRAFTPLGAAAGAELQTDLDEDSVARVETGALRQVIVNLLDNAVKFGPKGQQVHVTVRRAGTEIVVSVADQGPGVPAAERERVFQPFVQGSSSQRVTTGAGIGLAVVADLVGAHGGRVWIDDAPAGSGAQVSFALPAVDAAQDRLPVPAYAVRSEDEQDVLTVR